MQGASVTPRRSAAQLKALNIAIRECERCPRLAAYLDESREKHPDYWSRPVSGYGDPRARLFILGLAPGLHGANRHGRVFTGDDSGRWLWGALYELGICSEPNSTSGSQPLQLSGVWISNAARCAPPQNRPSTQELAACRDFLGRELELLADVRVVLALGRLAHESYLKLRGLRPAHHPFSHGAVLELPGKPAVLVDSYHPSRQNTNTRVLTREMWIAVIQEALGLAGVR